MGRSYKRQTDDEEGDIAFAQQYEEQDENPQEFPQHTRQGSPKAIPWTPKPLRLVWVYMVIISVIFSAITLGIFLALFEGMKTSEFGHELSDKFNSTWKNATAADYKITIDALPNGRIVAIFFVFVFLLQTIINPVWRGFLDYTLIVCYYGGPTTMRETFMRVIRLLPALYINAFLYVSVVAIGTICFIIPGVIVWSFFCLSSVVILVEETGPIQAFSRSMYLIRGGNFCKTLYILVFVFVLSMCMVTEVVDFAMGVTPVRGITMISFTVGLIFTLVSVAMVLLYFDLRERRGEIASTLGGPVKRGPITISH
eukprot:Colp12_sorted_trinity150504_noHs@3721